VLLASEFASQESSTLTNLIEHMRGLSVLGGSGMEVEEAEEEEQEEQEEEEEEAAPAPPPPVHYQQQDPAAMEENVEEEEEVRLKLVGAHGCT
jgi:hypothetical protein